MAIEIDGTPLRVNTLIRNSEGVYKVVGVTTDLSKRTKGVQKVLFYSPRDPLTLLTINASEINKFNIEREGLGKEL